jgi:hypothetical protein
MLGLVFVSLLGLSLWTCREVNAQAGWTPDKLLSDKLDTTADIDDFQLRVPSNYRPVTKEIMPGSMMTAWVGTARADRTQPYVLVTIQTVLDGDMSKVSAEGALNRFLEPAEKTSKNWTKTATEKGVINGLNFVRARWRGQDPATGKIRHGFSYVTVKDRKIIQISSQDLESYQKDGLGLAETAALTFKKRF